jgi:hypothetical protein
LLGHSEEFGRNYEFQFLTEKEAAARNESSSGEHWFRVGQVLEMTTHSQVFQYLVKHKLGDNEVAGELLFKLHNVVTQAPLINYYLEKDQDFDKVLNIFVRVNSGGKPLSNSDLLLSVATAQWTSHDAREEINGLVDELNMNGRFRFDKDFVLKSCLVLTDIPSVRFRVSNFNVTNTRLIEEQWPSVEGSLRLAVSLIASFGFTGQTLTSANAIIPIAYYLLKREMPVNFVDSSAYIDDRNSIRQWLLSALLSGSFSGQSDTVLAALRTTIGANPGQFPISDLADRLASLNKPLILTFEQIDALLDARYGQSHSFMVLATLYGWLDYRNLFHEDHIFPRSLFTKTRLTQLGISPDDIEFYFDNVDRLPNLQLLQGIINQEKSNQPYDEWIRKAEPTAEGADLYRQKHMIPADVAPTVSNFRQFFVRRRELMAKRLAEVIGKVPMPPLT